MNTKSFFALIIGFSMVLISCKKEVPVVEKSANSETNTTVSDSLQPLKITTDPSAPALNPPHGQPHHRCDIAVGAPLNSTAKQTQPTLTQPVQTQPVQIQPTQTQQAPVTVAPTGVKPKMNPPHGQPYHRCEIQVGAPLPDA